jgi:uncharacterized protein
MTEEEFLEQVLANKTNAEILRRIPALNLAECHLTAGCLFQAVWNIHSRREPSADVKDYDIFYFDTLDLSKEAEDTVNQRSRELFSDLNATVEVKNQARVHTWYESYFGSSYPQLTSAKDGIGRFLVECTCVGIEVGSRTVFAPNGFDDLCGGTLRMNPATVRPDLFRAKAESYRARWPWLSMMEPV